MTTELTNEEFARIESLKFYDQNEFQMKKQPYVSVIMPVYNCKRYVTIAIESVRMQSWRAIELIIVDDASDDGTTELLQKVIDERNGNVKVIYRKQNGGTAQALNDGIKEARGDYIKWLSADDVLYPDAIRDLMTFGVEDNYAQAKNAIFYSDYDIIDERGAIIGEFIEPDRSKSDHEAHVFELWNRFYGNGSSSLIHKNVFKKCGLFDGTLRHSEDYEFWLRCSVLFNVNLIRVPIKTLKYRRHPDQLTNKIGGSLDSQIKESIKIRQKQLIV